MRKVKKALQNLMFIFCEGEKTEPRYLENYIDDHIPHKSKVISIPKTKKNTPLQLVEEAIRKKRSDSSLDGDIFWVVYDRESEKEQPRAKHLEAWNKAESHGINIAISNVCFEFWILLHFEQTTKPYTSYQNLMTESRLINHLKKLKIDRYEKGDDELYFKISERLKEARERAKIVNKLSEQNCNVSNCKKFDYSPYTGITDLLDAIDTF